MSYARMATGKSDVYVYLDVSGYMRCQFCALNQAGLSFWAPKTADMLAHLDEHSKAGHAVSEDTIEVLNRDKRQNDSKMKARRRQLRGGLRREQD